MMNEKKENVPPKRKKRKATLTYRAMQLFHEVHNNYFGYEYHMRAQDTRNLKFLMKRLLKFAPLEGWTDDEMLQNLRLYLEAVLAMNDQFYINQFNPSFLYGQFDTIYKKLKAGNYGTKHERAVRQTRKAIDEFLNDPNSHEYI